MSFSFVLVRASLMVFVGGLSACTLGSYREDCGSGSNDKKVDVAAEVACRIVREDEAGPTKPADEAFFGKTCKASCPGFSSCKLPRSFVQATFAVGGAGVDAGTDASTGDAGAESCGAVTVTVTCSKDCGG